MLRLGKALASLASLLAMLSQAPAARAQTCAGARPDYGGADRAFHDSASGRVRVHFARAGASAPPAESSLEDGVPDAVVVAAQAAEDALAEYERLGYEPPLSDGASPCADNGGSAALDVYLLHFSAADGQAGIDHCEPGTSRCAGFVLVENDFRGAGYASTEEGVRTVVPHEVFHLVQNAYDADLERWWAEGSAQWAAKQVYPELQDLERFLPAYFDVPWRPLNVPPPGIITNFLYATAIWPVFLEERFGADLVRAVFEELNGAEGALPAADRALQARGSSLASEFVQFAAYNAATGRRAPVSGGYESAREYPEVPVETLEARTPTDTASGLGAFYYRVPEASPELRLVADPERVAALLLPLKDGQVDLAAAQPLPARTEGEAIVVVAAQTLARTDAPFELVFASPSPTSGAESSGCSLAAPPGAPGPALLWLVGFALRRSSRQRKGDPRCALCSSL
ncbi:MAG: hypothetical protein EOO73_20765 [Myxococcales bacterium]|nr:MAG: hypothetical protein EOO73_20765 [Myxococcales bacterium]